jgi:HAD superfamily hydrolase (TIGR01490 family)
MTPVAFFDVDGTILRGDIVRHFVRLRTWDLPAIPRMLWTGAFLLRLPGLLALDALDRARFQCALYAGYRAMTPAELARRAPLYVERWLLPRLFPAAQARIARHLQQHHHVVLVSGSLAPIVAPIATHVGATATLAPCLDEAGGKFTGRLDGPPLAGARKAEAARTYAAEHGVPLDACFAYADSRDDVPLLECVGHATVVSPGRRLRRLARRRQWEIVSWSPDA